MGRKRQPRSRGRGCLGGVLPLVCHGPAPSVRFGPYQGATAEIFICSGIRNLLALGLPLQSRCASGRFTLTKGFTMNWNIRIIGRWCIAILLCAYVLVLLFFVGFSVMKDIAAVKAKPLVYVAWAPAVLSTIAMASTLWPRAKFKARARSRPRSADEMSGAVKTIIANAKGWGGEGGALYQDIVECMHDTHDISEKETAKVLNKLRDSGKVRENLPFAGAKAGIGTRYIVYA